MLDAPFRPAYATSLAFLAFTAFGASSESSIHSRGSFLALTGLSPAETAEVTREQRQGKFPFAVRALKHSVSLSYSE